MAEPERHDALKTGYRMLCYRVESILGCGGFGITYLAYDLNLDRRNAIKEYLPVQFAERAQDGCIYPVDSRDSAAKYNWGLDRFLKEARILARCEHPNIVRVLNVFEKNNSAYMVMAYEEGESLKEILQQRGTLDETELLAILFPILDGLEEVHNQGFIHRDIKPGNLFIRKDGSPMLLDFGSARHAPGVQSSHLTILCSPGYAPIEQFGQSEQQGPWSDIYGLGATLYTAIVGVAPLDVLTQDRKPAEVVANTLHPELQKLRGRYSGRFLKAVDHALQFRPQDRARSVAEWRKEFRNPKVIMSYPGLKKFADSTGVETVSMGRNDSSHFRIPSSADTVHRKNTWRQYLAGVVCLTAILVAIWLFGHGLGGSERPFASPEMSEPQILLQHDVFEIPAKLDSTMPDTEIRPDAPGHPDPIILEGDHPEIQNDKEQRALTPPGIPQNPQAGTASTNKERSSQPEGKRAQIKRAHRIELTDSRSSAESAAYPDQRPSRRTLSKHSDETCKELLLDFSLESKLPDKKIASLQGCN